MVIFQLEHRNYQSLYCLYELYSMYQQKVLSRHVRRRWCGGAAPPARCVANYIYIYSARATGTAERCTGLVWR